jgi:predicted metal-dependent phosphoesterase TrpH
LTQRSTVDLHIHSTASDGRLTPAEVVRLAVELGLSTIALTDHETTAGLSEAQTAAASHDLRVLSGIELGTETEAGLVDILGYCFEPEHGGLQAALVRLREGRQQRARAMVEKLRQLDVPLTWERVQALAGDSVIGRPHVARALLEAGHVSSLGEAFERWISSQGPAYVPRPRLSPQEAITLIREAGGLAVLAHPVRSEKTTLVPALAEVGLGGLEVYYPEHNRADVKHLLRLCRRYNLIPTGGSDFHGLSLDGTAQLGSVAVPPETVERLPC